MQHDAPEVSTAWALGIITFFSLTISIYLLMGHFS